MIRIGLTGSIGMGKSTTAEMFKKLGCFVIDSDEIVHRLYSGKAAPIIEESFPGTVFNGVVDRTILATHVVGNAGKMKKLEKIVHPLVREETMLLLERAENEGANLAVIDIPLLFETQSQNAYDYVVVVSADEEIQRERVLSRKGMNEKMFLDILSKQMPDSEKRARADFTVDSGNGIEFAEKQVKNIIRSIEKTVDNRNL